MSGSERWLLAQQVKDQQFHAGMTGVYNYAVDRTALTGAVLGIGSSALTGPLGVAAGIGAYLGVQHFRLPEPTRADLRDDYDFMYRGLHFLDFALTSIISGVVTPAAGAIERAAEEVAAEAAGTQAAQATPKLLNQFNSVDSLLENAGRFTRVKGGVRQAVIKGNGEGIFSAISQGGQKLRSGAVRLEEGTIINRHSEEPLA